MFLTRVYRYNKGLLAFMLFFVIAQLFVNYKRGLVVTPFFHYGMYSHRINIEKGYQIIKVEVEGKILRGADFSPHSWDKILLPIVYFSNIKQSNNLYYSEIRRLTGIIHLTTKEENFIQQCNSKSFENWYKNYLEKIVGHSIKNCRIQLQFYNFTNSSLQQIDSVTRLSILCN